jgi:protein phosphatase
MGVSDGLGGHPGGDIAAEIVVNCLESINIKLNITSSLLQNAINRADKIISDKIRTAPEFRGMGATATSVVVSGGWGHWAHIGDSRLYLIRDNAKQKITQDHSFMDWLINNGNTSVEDAETHPLRHVLEQCVGCIVSGIDIGRFKVQKGDILLVCSDGLYRAVEESSITNILATTESVSQCVDQLIDVSLQAANCDDVTVVLAKVIA